MIIKTLMLCMSPSLVDDILEEELDMAEQNRKHTIDIVKIWSCEVHPEFRFTTKYKQLVKLHRITELELVASIVELYPKEDLILTNDVKFWKFCNDALFQ